MTTRRERTPERELPDTVVMEVPGMTAREARVLAREAVNEAQRRIPKLSGASSRRLTPVYGDGFYGIHWQDDHVWYQEMGIRPFTMRSLAGKVIPMWIDDPTGVERRRNPRARVRRTASGKVQVLIFRKAADIGSRKQVPGRFGTPRWVPRSYPGAPGRITIREAGRPYTTAGRRAGAVARSNVGVRWRHPGLQQRFFLHHSLVEIAYRHGVQPGEVRAVVSTAYRPRIRRRRRRIA